MNRSLVIVALGALCTGLVGSHRSAQAAEPDEAAKRAYEAGKTAFEERRYVEASDHFRAAYELKPSWKIFYNIGQAEAAGKRYGLALEAFEKYLARGGDEVELERQDAVMAEIVRLRNLVGYFKISAPDGAEIVMDGVRRGTAPIQQELPVAASIQHTIRAVVGGETVDEKQAQVVGGRTVEIALGPEEAPVPAPAGAALPAAAPTRPAPASPAPKRSPLRLLGWTALGIGAGLLVAGVATGGIALAKERRLADDCADMVCPLGYDLSPQETRDRLALATDILLPTGAVLAAAGAGLVLFDALRSKNPSERARARFHLIATPNLAGLAFKGRF